ncbi:MAG: S8 family serine peptidase [Planctomycetes bacterium]|nr:S8 family serine peptidase [Planctomycetota bacterium]
MYHQRMIAPLAAAAAVAVVSLSWPGHADDAWRTRPSADLGAVPGAAPGAAVIPGDVSPDASYTLTLGEVSFDPVAAEPVLPIGLERARDDGPDLRLVQFTGPTQNGWLDALEAAGLEIVQYIHPHSYVTWGAADALDAAADDLAVRWTGDFAPAYRLLPAFRDLPEAPVDMRVLMYRGADTDGIQDTITNLGAVYTGGRVLNHTWEIAGFVTSGAALADIARIPGVYNVKLVPTDGGLRGEMSNQICAGNYDAGNEAFPGYGTWLDGIGVHGDGVILANVDGGIQDNHPDLFARMLSCVGTTCGGGATSSHGTHTAGIMAAMGGSGVLDSWGFLRGLGVAPGATMVEQVYSPYFTQPGGMLLLMYDSAANGAIASGNSWGPAGSPQGYDDDTLQTDIGARDTDPNTPGDQPLCYVLSIMNGYGGTSSQGTPDEAKNIFTIGSTKAQQVSGAQILEIDDVSGNSAHGPCLDGRIVPHLVAPGCEVDSCNSGSSHTTKCGTSMASPHVTGAVALFVEHYRNRPQYTVDPSPAMIKAAFLPVAHDLAGHHDADGGILGHPFDNKQGWGRMNLPAVVAPPDNSVRYFDQEVIFDNTGEEWSINLSPLDPSKPVRIMLVWTDAPGHGLGGSTPAWNNDLDLIVEVGGNSYYGNDFGPDGFSVTGGTPDDRNNTEGVFLGPIPPGNFDIRVVAADINSDALPNVGDITDQDFAIVAYNVAEEPGFAMSSTPNAQTLCAPGDVVYDIEVDQILGYTDSVTLSASGMPAGVTGGFSVNPVTPPQTVAFTATADAGVSFGTYTITIDGDAPGLNRSTNLSLTLVNAVPGPSALSSPPDGAIDLVRKPTLTWQPASQVVNYEVEIALDPLFTNIVYTASVPDTNHEVELNLDLGTAHYWRLRGTNACGTGPDSTTFGFTTIDQLDYFTEEIPGGDIDLANRTLSFVPDGSSDFYDACLTPITELPIDPAGGVVVVPGDDSSTLINIFGPPVSLYGAMYGNFYLNSNGHLTFGAPDSDPTVSLTNHFSIPRISALYNNLDPGTQGIGDVSYKVLGDRLVVSYEGVTEAGLVNSSTFQIEMHYNGEIRLSYLEVEVTQVAIVGLSDGSGLPGDFLGTDASATPPCASPCVADLDGSGDVGFGDILNIIGAWGPCVACPQDLDDSGDVGFGDILAVIGAWGSCN